MWGCIPLVVRFKEWTESVDSRQKWTVMCFSVGLCIVARVLPLKDDMDRLDSKKRQELYQQKKVRQTILLFFLFLFFYCLTVYFEEK